MCRMKTKDNKCCVFPFVYRGKSYDSCVKGRANSHWCALSPSYDDDRKYGYCRGTLFNLYKKRPSNPLLGCSQGLALGTRLGADRKGSNRNIVQLVVRISTCTLRSFIFASKAVEHRHKVIYPS